MSKTSSAAKNKYNAKAYDRITLVVPKGQKDMIVFAAETAGESTNAYIQRAILNRMGLDDWEEITHDD